MTKLPPLRAVQAFEAVGRCGSVTGAAQELNVSASAITQQVHVLEKSLGARLVQRTGRGISLTGLGSRYLTHIATSLEHLRLGTREIERIQNSRRLRVSTLPSTQWLTPCLFEWRRRHPQMDIVLESSDLEPRLDEGEADYRISYGQRYRAHRRYAYLFTDEVVPVGSPALLAAQQGRILNPCDVLNFPLLWIDWGPEYMAPPAWPEWLAHAGVAGVRARCDFTFSLSSAAVEAAISGMGLLLAQQSMISRALASGQLVKLFDAGMPLPESYFLAWSASASERPLDADLRSWLIASTARLDRRRKRDVAPGLVDTGGADLQAS